MMAREPALWPLSPKGAHVVRRIFPYIRHHETHRQLVGRGRSVAGRAWAGLDAIIVPASRPASNLDHAVTLARAFKCTLLVLCSRETRVEQVEELLTARCFSQAVVVGLPHDYVHPLLKFASSGLARRHVAGVCDSPNGDLSTKRNLGLLLARMTGWGRIFFMDDDVRDVGPADLLATVSLLARYQSVGMRVTHYPDNSVVCHANRETGAGQDVFVSGSVLAVNSLKPLGFFPEIYNEDWFFFYDDVRAGRLGWSGRDATQLQYDPFGHTRRAEREEFGDILAEGLYALLHLGGGATDATREYWDVFLAERQGFLENIIKRSHRAAPQIREKLLEAVHTAMRCLRRIEPKECESYVKAWRQDLRAWVDATVALPTGLSVDSALRELELTPAQSWAPACSLPATGGRSMRKAQPGQVSIPQIATAGFRHNPGGIGPARGRHRRGRILAAAGLHPIAEPARPNPLDSMLGQDVPWAEATDRTEPMHLGGLLLPDDPARDMAPAADELAAVGLAEAGDPDPLEGHPGLHADLQV